MDNLLEKENDNFKSSVSNTCQEFFNKKDMEKDSYFTKYIYNRKSILQKIVNILITSDLMIIKNKFCHHSIPN